LELDINGGVVLLDEPELHLYPGRQRIMLAALSEISSVCNLQFIVMSHSPWMVDNESISNTFRVFKKDDASDVYAPPKDFLEKSKSKDLVQIVNVLNSEKMFFSDKVILVEGVGDRIIFEELLRELQNTLGINEEIQIIEVFGKGNLKKFRDFLVKWRIKSYIIADEDYADDLMIEADHKISKIRLISSLKEEGIFILSRGGD